MIVSATEGFTKVMALDADGWAASRVDGVWAKGLAFSADELAEDFSRVNDSATSAKLVAEAKTSLSVAVTTSISDRTPEQVREYNRSLRDKFDHKAFSEKLREQALNNLRNREQ